MRVHRIDLVMAEMNQPEAITPVLHAITSTLSRGHDVWLVGSISIERSNDVPPGPIPPPPRPSEMPTQWWGGSYMYWWNQQVATFLLDHAEQEKVRNICYARTGKPFRRRFSHTIHRLQARHGIVRAAIVRLVSIDPSSLITRIQMRLRCPLRLGRSHFSMRVTTNVNGLMLVGYVIPKPVGNY